MRRTRVPNAKARDSKRTDRQAPLKLTPALVLKAGKERSLIRRHPWVYASAVAQVRGKPQSGDTVAIVSHEDRFLAWASYSASSSIRGRAWTYQIDQPVTAALVHARIAAAVARRAPLQARSNALRLVFGEADQLPGLIIDRYADQLVIQFLAAGAEHWRDQIIRAALAVTGCVNLYERSDAQVREREGLPIREGGLHGIVPAAPIHVIEDGVHYAVDVISGHKTGFYIDQRDNRARVARQAAGRRVLNCFCYTGGFTLAALAGGASAAVSIDSSEPALLQAKANQQLNPTLRDLKLERSQWRMGNVFEQLKAMAAGNEKFDLIVLDPPKFAPSASHLDRAARAYKEINMKALKLLAPGGLLFTFSCSGVMSLDLFQKVVAGAIVDAQVDAQLIERLHAGVDHPVLMTHPEGEYLKGLLLQVV